MMETYQTVEEAMAALEVGIADCMVDFPGVSEIDAYAGIYESIVAMSSPEVAAQMIEAK